MFSGWVLNPQPKPCFDGQGGWTNSFLQGFRAGWAWAEHRHPAVTPGVCGCCSVLQGRQAATRRPVMKRNVWMRGEQGAVVLACTKAFLRLSHTIHMCKSRCYNLDDKTITWELNLYWISPYLFFFFQASGLNNRRLMERSREYLLSLIFNSVVFQFHWIFFFALQCKWLFRNYLIDRKTGVCHVTWFFVSSRCQSSSSGAFPNCRSVFHFPYLAGSGGSWVFIFPLLLITLFYYYCVG